MSAPAPHRGSFEFRAPVVEINQALRRRNFALGIALFSAAGGAYAWTYSKMRNNELTAIASELDQVRKEKAKLAAAATPTPASK